MRLFIPPSFSSLLFAVLSPCLARPLPSGIFFKNVFSKFVDSPLPEAIFQVYF